MLIYMSCLYSLVPYNAKQKTTRVPTIDANNDIVPPLDFSFYRINNVAGKDYMLDFSAFRERWGKHIYFVNR